MYIAARTVLFVALVVHNKNNALAAFAFAQVSSSILFCLMYYIFFWWYIRQFNYVQSLLKKDKDDVRQMPKMFTRMQDFKFKSVMEFLPGRMDNTGVRFKQISICHAFPSYVSRGTKSRVEAMRKFRGLCKSNNASVRGITKRKHNPQFALELGKE